MTYAAEGALEIEGANLQIAKAPPKEFSQDGAFLLHIRANPSRQNRQVFVRYCFGGGEGNRTPVRKLADIVFSERSHDFGIPLTERLAAGFRLR